MLPSSGIAFSINVTRRCSLHDRHRWMAVYMQSKSKHSFGVQRAHLAAVMHAVPCIQVCLAWLHIAGVHHSWSPSTNSTK